MRRRVNQSSAVKATSPSDCRPFDRLNAAVAQGHIHFNRADAIDLIPKEEGIKEAFKREEVQILLATTDDLEWFGLILVGYFIAARLGDCASLTHEAIDYVAKTLKYEPIKQKRSAPKREEMTTRILQTASR